MVLPKVNDLFKSKRLNVINSGQALANLISLAFLKTLSQKNSAQFTNPIYSKKSNLKKKPCTSQKMKFSMKDFFSKCH